MRTPSIVVSLLAVQALLLARLAFLMYPTIDEPAHLASGLAHWKTGDFELYKVNPPLVRLIASIPALVGSANVEWLAGSGELLPRSEFALATSFVAREPRFRQLMIWSRWALIPLILLGGYICCRWACELAGPLSGYIALVLWCFSPNILAYGATITPDAAAASLGLVANYFFWKWLSKPRWDGAFWTGLALGCAVATKSTWVILFPIWPVLWLSRRALLGRTAHDAQIRLRQGRPWRALGQLTLIGTGAIYVINVVYGFDRTGVPLGHYEFASRALTTVVSEPPPRRRVNRFRDSVIGCVPAPLPRKYIEGIDVQWRDFELGKPSYLLGTWQERGWWYWYLYALGVKVTLGVWGLALLALALRAIVAYRASISSLPTDWTAEAVLLAPVATVLLLLSWQSGFTRYLRYALPVLPYVFIWVSATLGAALLKSKKLMALTVVLLSWSAGESLWWFPHSMSYFNELAGGPRGGPRHLLDANVDWGQDLGTLQAWLEANRGVKHLGLVYFGAVDPRVAGIEYTLPPKATRLPTDRGGIAAVPRDLRPGWYAISVNFLYGYPHYIWTSNGDAEMLDRAYYSYFRNFTPVAMAGYSIYIYCITNDDINAAALASNGLTRMHAPSTQGARRVGAIAQTKPARAHGGR